MPYSNAPRGSARLHRLRPDLVRDQLWRRDLYLRIPQPIVVGVAEAGVFTTFLTLGFVSGFILGPLPNLIGSLLMNSFSERVEEFDRRSPGQAPARCSAPASPCWPIPTGRSRKSCSP